MHGVLHARNVICLAILFGLTHSVSWVLCASSKPATDIGTSIVSVLTVQNNVRTTCLIMIIQHEARPLYRPQFIRRMLEFGVPWYKTADFNVFEEYTGLPKEYLSRLDTHFKLFSPSTRTSWTPIEHANALQFYRGIALRDEAVGRFLETFPGKKKLYTDRKSMFFASKPLVEKVKKTPNQ